MGVNGFYIYQESDGECVGTCESTEELLAIVDENTENWRDYFLANPYELVQKDIEEVLIFYVEGR